MKKLWCLVKNMYLYFVNFVIIKLIKSFMINIDMVFILSIFCVIDIIVLLFGIIFVIWNFFCIIFLSGLRLDVIKFVLVFNIK